MRISTQIDFELEGINIYGMAAMMPELSRGIMSHLIHALQEKVVEEKCGKTYERTGYVRRGYKSRTLTMDIGSIGIRVSRISKKGGRHVECPIEDLLGIPPRKQILNDASIKGINQITDLSYRKSVKSLKQLSGIDMSRSTLWRRVQELGLKPEKPDLPIDVIWVDDTEVKGIKSINYLSIILGRNNERNRYFLLDFAVNEDWYTLAKRLERKIDISNAYVVCDSERQIDLAFGGKVKGIQLCHFHAIKYLNYALWKENCPKNFRKKCRRKLEEILCTLQNSAKKFDRDRDSERLKRRIGKTFEQTYDLCLKLRARGFHSSADYLDKHKEQLVTFAYAKLEGVNVPYTNNREEREMRENAYRTKRIGARWSDRGLLKLGVCKFVERLQNRHFQEFVKNYVGGKGYIDFSIIPLGG